MGHGGKESGVVLKDSLPNQKNIGKNIVLPFKSTARAVNGSLYVVIPKDYASNFGISEGQVCQLFIEVSQ